MSHKHLIVLLRVVVLMGTDIDSYYEAFVANNSMGIEYSIGHREITDCVLSYKLTVQTLNFSNLQRIELIVRCLTLFIWSMGPF